MIHRVLAALCSWCVIGSIVLVPSVRADLVVSSVSTPVAITFDSTLTDVNNGEYLGEGFHSSPSNGQLDSDSWAVDAESATLSFGGTAGPGGVFGNGQFGDPIGVNVGGLWSFDVGGGNSTLGVQPHGSHFTPGSITLRVRNDTGMTITSWSVAYDIFSFNDSSRSTSVDFSYAVGTTTPGSFTSVPLLEFDSPPESDSAAWSGPTTKSTVIADSVASGSHLFLRWTFNTSNQGAPANIQDEVALDNISVTAVPEPGAVQFGAVLCAGVGLVWFIRQSRLERSCVPRPKGYKVRRALEPGLPTAP
jgi:hypothetical protein